MSIKAAAVLSFVSAAISLRADIMVQVPGPAQFDAGNSVFASSWTQTSTYDNVSITADVFGVPAAGVTATAWLSTAIGPGATIADQVATASITSSNLFSGLTLGPQTYYLVLLFNSGSNAAGWGNTAASTPVTAPGVSIGSSYEGSFLNFPSFGPSADLTPIGGQWIYSVSGVSGTSPVPEPVSFLLFGTVLAVLGVVEVMRRKGVAQLTTRAPQALHHSQMSE